MGRNICLPMQGRPSHPSWLWSLTLTAWMMKCRGCPSHSTLSTYSCLPWLSRTRKSPLQVSSSCTSERGMAPWYQTCWHSGFCTSGIRGTGGGSWKETS